MRRILAALLLIVLLASTAFAQGSLNVYFLDVGQGDANLIVAPSGEVVLIDSGPSETAILGHLERLGIARIDLIISSHAHADHITGMDTLIERYRPRAYMDPGLPHTTRTYERLLEAVKTHGIPYYEAAQRKITLGPVVLSILPPADPLIAKSSLNNNSAVVRLDYGEFSVLFTGDIEKEREAQLLTEAPGELDVIVLKAPHHGSSSSSTRAFLQAVNPNIAVISCGRDNQYGHPHRETLIALQALNIDTYQTNESGTIHVKSDGSTYKIIPEVERARGPPPVRPDTEAIPKPDASIKYVASRRSEVFHYPRCVHAKEISPHNLVEFDTREKAVESGRRPCKRCRP